MQFLFYTLALNYGSISHASDSEKSARYRKQKQRIRNLGIEEWSARTRDIECKTARVAARMAPRGASDIDGQTERSIWREHMSQSGDATEFKGISEIEGKVARVATSERGSERVSTHERLCQPQKRARAKADFAKDDACFVNPLLHGDERRKIDGRCRRSRFI